MAQAAGDPAHKLLGRVKNFLRDFARVHQVARQNEQGNRNEQEGVNAADHLLADDHKGIAQREAAQNRRSADGDADGDADNQQCRKGEQKDYHAIFLPVCFSWRPAAS